jgi:hypothetical protein
LALAAISAAIIAAPVALPTIVTTIAGYLATVLSGVSQIIIPRDSNSLWRELKSLPV